MNLLTVGLTSFNLKQQIPSDIPLHNQFIPAENLKTQDWLHKINAWTEQKKMMINEKKTKCMIFNYTEKHQFTTRLEINKQQIDVIDSTRLLGTIITNNLCWDMNTNNIVKKANARMELLRRVAEFGTPVEDMKEIYILFIRSILEQSATVWHSSLTQENTEDLERAQKSASKLMLENSEMSYKTRLSWAGNPVFQKGNPMPKLCP